MRRSVAIVGRNLAKGAGASIQAPTPFRSAVAAEWKAQVQTRFEARVRRVELKRFSFEESYAPVLARIRMPRRTSQENLDTFG